MAASPNINSDLEPIGLSPSGIPIPTEAADSRLVFRSALALVHQAAVFSAASKQGI